MNQDFKLPHATFFDDRKGHNQKKWREIIEERREIYLTAAELDCALLQGRFSTEGSPLPPPK